MSKQHILIVSQCFYPEPFRINDICQEWIRRGYRVTVLTGIPNYPQGRFYSGYDWFHKRNETWQGIVIRRIPLIPRGHNALMLVLNYLAFVVSGFIWQLFKHQNADVVFTIGLSPLTQALPGVWFARKRRIPCYIYVQDLWPDNVIMMTGIKNRLFVGWINRIVNSIYTRCKRIFTASNSFITALQERGVPAEKLEYWPQYAEDHYRPQEKRTMEEIDEEAFNILFAGNIGYAQGQDILPRTAKIIRDHSTRQRICFVIVGDGRYKENLLELVKQFGVQDFFRFIPRQPSATIPAYYAACDLAFLSLSDHPIYAMTIPAKLQSHMACGIPTLAAVVGETRDIIMSSKSGVCVNPGNAEQLAEAILVLVKMSPESLKQMGENALVYYRDHYQKDRLFDRMDTYLRQTMKEND